jgi:hypothetical protein
VDRVLVNDAARKVTDCFDSIVHIFPMQPHRDEAIVMAKKVIHRHHHWVN